MRFKKRQFRLELSPILGEQTVEVIARGSEALDRINEQVSTIMSHGFEFGRCCENDVQLVGRDVDELWVFRREIL